MAVLLLGVAALASGCAQQRSSGYYDVPRESSTTDAQYRAQNAGHRTVVHAPAQLQIDLNRDTYIDRANAKGPAPGVPGTDEPAPPLPAGGAEARMVARADAPPATANADGPVDPAIQAFMPQAQTYVGTLPCLAGELQCQAQRVTLTLAPNGRWRARTAYLGTSQQAQPSVEQGCWNATQGSPVQVILLNAQGDQRVELQATQNNVLRVRSVMGKVPNLTYNLTRQPDLDAIAELDGQAAPNCL